MTNEERDGYLEHHGILGMKWGIRRYQNKDGTLTAAGRKRYLNDDGSYNEIAKKEIPKVAMSNSELQETINRIVLEKRYDEVTKADGGKEQGRLAKLFSDVASSFLDEAQTSIKGKLVDVMLTNTGLKERGLEDMDAAELLSLMNSQSNTHVTLNMRDANKLAKYKKNIQSIIRGMTGESNNRDRDDDD